MSVLYLLIPIAIVFLIIAVAFFFWAIKHGQYDDMESQALKIVMDDSNSTTDNSTEKGTEHSTENKEDEN